MSDALTGSVSLLDGLAFTATGGSGHTITVDAASEHGGSERGPRPMELLLLGLGSCTAMDVMSLLRKMRQNVEAYTVELHADRAEAHPKVMTDITVTHVIRGRNFDLQLVRRAIELSATRYCPASAMLSKAATIHHRFRAVDDASNETTEALVVDTPLTAIGNE